MSNKIVNLRLLLLYDFKSGLNATQSCQRINSAFGDGKIALRTAQHWFVPSYVLIIVLASVYDTV